MLCSEQKSATDMNKISSGVSDCQEDMCRITPNLLNKKRVLLIGLFLKSNFVVSLVINIKGNRFALPQLV